VALYRDFIVVGTCPARPIAVRKTVGDAPIAAAAAVDASELVHQHHLLLSTWDLFLFGELEQAIIVSFAAAIVGELREVRGSLTAS
jgi:hypothetical protein